MGKKVVIDADECIGCESCVELCAEVFAFNEAEEKAEVIMAEGQTIEWAGRSVRCARLIQRELPGRLVEEVRLEISRDGDRVATLVPGQHLHRLQNEWTTEVAIHSTFSGDLYAILHGGAGEGRVDLTLIENPMMRWIWLGGWLAGVGSLVRLWPSRSRAPSAVPAPKWIGRRKRIKSEAVRND